MRDQLAVMRTLWRDEVAHHTGAHHSLQPSWAWPKPVTGDVPIWLGVGAGPVGLADVAELADVWAPHGAAGIAAALPRLAAACESAGRDPATVRTVPFGTRPTPGKLDHLAELGIDEIVVLLPDPSRDAALAELERVADLLTAWRGAAPFEDGPRARPATAPLTDQTAPTGVGGRRT